MAGKQTRKSRKQKQKPRFRPGRFLLRWAVRLTLAGAALILLLTLLFAVVNPPTTHTILTESRRLGGVERDWVRLEDIAPVMARSAVAAEDANFCYHWGFDVDAIRAAIAQGGARGGSTISQQVVKNVFLWQGRSYLRKLLEAGITPMVEAIWSKRRIIEIYLNVAEFDEGVFGVGAAAPHYFGVSADQLSPLQAARLAAILPAPKSRSASRPTAATRRKTARIMDGAATIRRDGRAACFED